MLPIWAFNKGDIIYGRYDAEPNSGLVGKVVCKGQAMICIKLSNGLIQWVYPLRKLSLQEEMMWRLET